MLVREAVAVYSENHIFSPDFCFEKMRKRPKILSQDSRTAGRGSNSVPPEYEVGI
jgi:hypothetical protein